MKTAIIIFGAILFLIANLTFADLIYFDNGDVDEGYATAEGAIMTITSKDKKGEYGVSTNRVLRVETGLWFKDLNKIERNIAEASKNMETVKKTLSTIGEVHQTVVPQVQRELEKLNKKFSFLPSSNGSKAMRISNYFLFFVFFTLVIVSAVCNIIVLIDAFKNSIVWGILSLFVPIVLFIYLLTGYRGNKGKTFFWIISPLIWFGLMLLAFSQQNI